MLIRLLPHVAIAALVGALIVALSARHDDALAQLLDAHRERSARLAEHQAERVGAVFARMYGGLRTMSRLPGVRAAVAAGEPLTGDARVTVQELYNALGSEVALSEVYLVPRDIDPDAPEGTVHLEPLVTFDELITGTSGGGAAGEHAAEGDGLAPLPETEVFEYRLMKAQVAELARDVPERGRVRDLDVPMLTGPKVITCDNSRMDRGHLDDERRTGIVMSVPVFGPDDRLAGLVSGIVLQDAVADLLDDGGYAVADLTHDQVIGKVDGAWRAHLEEARRAEPLRRALVSGVVPLAMPPGAGEWRVWYARPDEDFAAQRDVSDEIGFHRLTVWVTVGIAVAAALVTLLAQVRAARLRRRVARLLDAVSRATSGDLGVAIDIGAGDAVGRIGVGVTSLIGSQRATVGAVRDAGDEIARTATAIASGSRASGAAADAGVEAQAAVAGEVSEVLRRADTMARAVSGLTEAVQGISSSTRTSAEQARAAVTQADAAQAALGELVERSREIDGVARAIATIAAQTNMLALNANIEAARAGAAGQGFAVVANEVKELARQAGESAVDIGERLAALRAGTLGVDRAVAAVADAIRGIDRHVQEIARAVEQQATSARDLADDAQGVSAAMGRVDGELARATEASNESAMAAQTLRASADGLVALSERLQQVVGAWRA